jgi:hypothetical protein
VRACGGRRGARGGAARRRRAARARAARPGPGGARAGIAGGGRQWCAARCVGAGVASGCRRRGAAPARAGAGAAARRGERRAAQARVSWRWLGKRCQGRSGAAQARGVSARLGWSEARERLVCAGVQGAGACATEQSRHSFLAALEQVARASSGARAERAGGGVCWSGAAWMRTGAVQERVRRCGPRRANGRGQGRAARLIASEVGVGAAGDAAARMECAGGVLARQFGVDQYEDNKAPCVEYLVVVWHGRPQQDVTRTKNVGAMRQGRSKRR